MEPRKDIFGYYLSPYESVPNHDPGLSAPCPICGKILYLPVKTISIMRRNDPKSYFYRTHKFCYDNAPQKEIDAIDHAFVEATI